MLAMKFGDHCWLKGLEKRPELNGSRVVLNKWLDEAQRWRCKPRGWSFDEEFLCVRPRNLSNEPVPVWAVRTRGMRIEAGEQLTDQNMEVFCRNAKDFADCQLEVPKAPTLEEITGTNRRRVPTEQEQVANDMARAEIAVKVEALLKRDSELSKLLKRPTTNVRLDLERKIKHSLCSRECVLAQIQLFTIVGRTQLVEQARAKLQEVKDRLEHMASEWEGSDFSSLDFWEDPVEDEHADALR